VIVGGKLHYCHGAIPVPTAPGLGVKLDRDKLGEYHEMFLRLGSYPYDQDPLRPGWTPTIPNQVVGGPEGRPRSSHPALSGSPWDLPLAESPLVATALFTTAVGRSAPPGEDGYDLWLRYRLVANPTRLAEYRRAISSIVIDTTSTTGRVIADELRRGLAGLLGRDVPLSGTLRDGAVIVQGAPRDPGVTAFSKALDTLGAEGFVLRGRMCAGCASQAIAAKSDAGALYGAFAFLRALQTEKPISNLSIVSEPHIKLRLLDHWDNLDRSVERGYAGQSLWNWASLP
jgi:hypothetical protein